MSKEYLEALNIIKFNPDDIDGLQYLEAFKVVETALQRLEAIDKLQEQLGCPLDVLFKALENGIYYVNGNHAFVTLHYYNVTKKYGLKDGMIINHLSDYKKTWWLKEDKRE